MAKHEPIKITQSIEANIADGNMNASVKIKRNRVEIELENGKKFTIHLDFNHRIKINKTDYDSSIINIQPCVSNEISIG